jgi:hypothetical protein
MREKLALLTLPPLLCLVGPPEIAKRRPDVLGAALDAALSRLFRPSMAESVARTTLNKARYFLSQAEIHQSDSDTSASRLPFVANLEAAIIYGHSVLCHLRKELAPKNPTYRAWHDAKRKVLKSNAVFRQFSDRRSFIVHEGPEKTSLTFFVAAKFKGTSSMSVEATSIRADGIVEPQGILTKSPVTPPEPEQPHRSETTPHIFYFTDPTWREKPAIEYVREFLDLIGPVVDAAETQFLK